MAAHVRISILFTGRFSAPTERPPAPPSPHLPDVRGDVLGKRREVSQKSSTTEEVRRSSAERTCENDTCGTSMIS